MNREFVVLDTECYINFWCAVIMTQPGVFETFIFDNETNDMGSLRNLFKELIANQTPIVGFNLNHYDIPMIHGALTARSNLELKNYNNAIIHRNTPPWQFYHDANIKQMKLNTIDVMQSAPSVAKLKMYGARLHSETIQELPIDPESDVDEVQKDVLVEYCKNDVNITYELYMELQEELKLRKLMGEMTKENLMSKSEAQIGETVLIKNTQIRGGRKITKPKKLDYSFVKYNRQEHLNFASEDYESIHSLYCAMEFWINEDGHCQFPKAIGAQQLYSEDYGLPLQFGIGGMHSLEKNRCIEANKNHLFELDVSSYYPSLAIEQNLFPKQCGIAFSEVYRELREKRFEYKRTNQTDLANCLKIALNGVFGKFSNKYSRLYDPQIGLQITVSGQLNLALLIDLIFRSGVGTVESANTDGILVSCSDDAKVMAIAKEWEELTGFTLDRTDYKLVATRNVNNYVALTLDGKIKAKGSFADRSNTRTLLSKNPHFEVCNMAIYEFLKHRTPIEKTILETQDVSAFVAARQVSGGAIENGKPIGSIIRWYKTTDRERSILYAKGGNRVPDTESAKSIQKLPWLIPADLDYSWYIQHTQRLMAEIGLTW